MLQPDKYIHILLDEAWHCDKGHEESKRKVATLMISAKDESIEAASSDATYVLR